MHGSNSWNQIEAEVNRMNPPYQDQVSITFQLTATYVHSSEYVLFSTDAGILLNQFRNHMLDTHTYYDYHVAHLYSGKNLDGCVLGVAWQPSIHGPALSHWSLTQFPGEFFCNYYGTDHDRTVVQVHEVGHNYNGDHDLAEWWYCGFLTYCYTVMWPSFQGLGTPFELHTTTFSTENADRVRAESRVKQVV